MTNQRDLRNTNHTTSSPQPGASLAVLITVCGPMLAATAKLTALVPTVTSVIVGVVLGISGFITSILINGQGQTGPTRYQALTMMYEDSKLGTRASMNERLKDPASATISGTDWAPDVPY